MKREALIKIKGVQNIDQQNDTTELMTQGIFYNEGGNYYISYDDSETTGNKGTTLLKIEGTNKVTMTRDGKSSTQLVIENGHRNIGQYGTPFGDMIMGVYTTEISNTLDDNGGNLHFAYKLDINSTLISEHEVFVQVVI